MKKWKIKDKDKVMHMLLDDKILGGMGLVMPGAYYDLMTKA